MKNIKEPPVKKIPHNIVCYLSTCMHYRVIEGRVDRWVVILIKRDQQLVEGGELHHLKFMC